MDPIFLFILIISILVAIFFITAVVFTISKGLFGEVALNSLHIALFAGLIGAVIGVLLSLFAIFSIGLKGLLGTIVLAISGFIILGFITWIFVFTYNGLPEQVRRIVLYVVIIPLILAIIVGLIWGLTIAFRSGTLPQYLKFASPLFEGGGKAFSELAKFRYCLYADPRCPFFVSWEDPNIQSTQEEFSVSVKFSEKNILSNDNLNMLVSLSVSNPELSELHVKPKCFLKKDKDRELDISMMGSYSYGDEFIFPTTAPGQKLHTSFRCGGEITEAIDKNLYTEYVVVELERPVAVKTIWPVWIGDEPYMGIVRSEMKFDAPYMISLGSNNDMPFQQGKEYDFQLTIKRKEEKVKLKKIESISILFPENILANCDHLEGQDHELQLNEYDYENLKELTQYDEELDKFIFPCSLFVSIAPTKAVMDPFELEAYYTVYSDHKTMITKSP